MCWGGGGVRHKDVVYLCLFKEKETEYGGSGLLLAVYSCPHGAQLNFDDLTPYIEWVNGVENIHRIT
jgi:hypothetical protein